ncbi:16S rRNA (cytosine(1402)-N(4))-methyltransferase RsmH [Candidatus Gracilibacteria bacterium]|nr:16S rRNA (cytosine(1402)-N(4))-methyltransferase RsmH [Candidatus Gracilibacteria bacterium]
MQVRVDENIHTSVLLEELVSGLDISQTQTNIIVDCTLGLGGHASLVLSKLKAGDIFIGFDADSRNLSLAKAQLEILNSQAQIILIESNFRYLREELQKRDIYICSGIYYDLGVSSLHFDEAERGFSLRLNGPLDMRFDTRNGKTAADILNYREEKDIFYILKNYGEEPYARKIAARIIEERKKKKFETTFELTDFLEKHINKHIKTKMRVFQALRIAVNEELTTLEESLEQARSLLSVGGKIAAISFHSLEDRIVKHFLKKYARDTDYDEIRREYKQKKEFQICTKKPILPSEQEQKNNPRSRSAKLRIAEKI